MRVSTMCKYEGGCFFVVPMRSFPFMKMCASWRLIGFFRLTTLKMHLLEVGASRRALSGASPGSPRAVQKAVSWPICAGRLHACGRPSVHTRVACSRARSAKSSSQEKMAHVLAMARPTVALETQGPRNMAATRECWPLETWAMRLLAAGYPGAPRTPSTCTST